MFKDINSLPPISIIMGLQEYVTALNLLVILTDTLVARLLYSLINLISHRNYSISFFSLCSNFPHYIINLVFFKKSIGLFDAIILSWSSYNIFIQFDISTNLMFLKCCEHELHSLKNYVFLFIKLQKAKHEALYKHLKGA